MDLKNFYCPALVLFHILRCYKNAQIKLFCPNSHLRVPALNNDLRCSTAWFRESGAKVKKKHNEPQHNEPQPFVICEITFLSYQIHMIHSFQICFWKEIFCSASQTTPCIWSPTWDVKQSIINYKQKKLWSPIYATPFVVSICPDVIWIKISRPPSTSENIIC